MAQLMDLEPLFADGYHNAFTDLLYWQGHYYLTFRTAQSHSIETPGDIRVYRSADLSTWTQCAHFDTGGDDRDPKLIDGGTRLVVLFGTFYPRWKGRSRPNAETDLISCIAVSRDGLSWSTPHQVFGPNYWLWRILPTPEGFYGAAYHFPSSRPHEGSIDLLFSEDLFNWRLKTRMRAGDDLSEPALYRPKPDILCCIIRAKEPRNHSWIGRSPAPYDRWSWTDLGAMIHAPVVLKKNDRWLRPLPGRGPARWRLPALCRQAHGPYHALGRGRHGAGALDHRPQRRRLLLLRSGRRPQRRNLNELLFATPASASACRPPHARRYIPGTS